MTGIHDLWAFVLAGIAVNLLPGPDSMYVVGRSLSQGRGAGVLSALGIAVGCLVHIVFAALGLSALLAQSALAFDVVKYIGAAYLLYLGISMVRSREQKSAAPVDASTAHLRVFTQGLLTNVFNPKVALFFLAFLPQFVDHQAGVLPFFVLGLLFNTTGTVWNLFLAWSAASVAQRFQRNQRFSAWLNRATGILFVALGLNLLRARLSPGVN